MFLGYGGDKEFVVKIYIDASFDTDLDDSKSWSISIGLDAQYVSSFSEVFLWKTPFKPSFMLSRKFYIISDQQYVIHIYLLERL